MGSRGSSKSRDNLLEEDGYSPSPANAGGQGEGLVQIAVGKPPHPNPLPHEDVVERGFISTVVSPLQSKLEQF